MSSTQPNSQNPRTVEIAVLANYGNEIIGAALQSKSLVRFDINTNKFSYLTFNTFAIWNVTIGPDEVPIDPSRPELIEALEITPVGQLNKKRQIMQLCSASFAPERIPLLGFNGPSFSYSQLTGRSPSVTIVELGKRQAIRSNSYGEITISFPWGPVIASVPIGSEGEREIFQNANRPLNTAKEIGAVLGFRPKYAVIGLARPKSGYCKKICFGLLPEQINRRTARSLREIQLNSGSVGQPADVDNSPQIIIDDAAND